MTKTKTAGSAPETTLTAVPPAAYRKVVPDLNLELEPEPKPVKLLPSPSPTNDRRDAPPPISPMADAGLPVPRSIHENERATAGLRRFKIRCDNYAGSPFRYVLTRTEAEACHHYLHRCTNIARLAEEGGPEAVEPKLVVVALPD